MARYGAAPFAVGGGPGMVRSAGGSAGFADFGRARASGFGAVALEDGPCPGYLAGAQGLEAGPGRRVAGGSGEGQMNDAEPDAFMDASAALLGLTIAPEWRDAVRANLAVTLRMGALVGEFDLLDEADPAPVFSA